MIAATSRRWLVSWLVIAACGSSATTPPPATGGGGEPPTAAQADGLAPRFAWRPGEFEMRTRSRTTLADGTTTEESSTNQRMVVREEAGHLVVTFPEQPEPDADAWGVALSNAYGLLRLELRPDGQIQAITGFDAFVDALAGKPGVAMSRAELEATRNVVEGTFEQDYVQWVVTWLDLGAIPKPGASVERKDGDVMLRASAEDAASVGPGLVRARFSLEGPVLRTTQTEMQAQLLYGELIAGELEPLFATATGWWEVEVVTDPNTLIPVVATTQTRLTASAGGRTLTATASHTTELVPLGR